MNSTKAEMGVGTLIIFIAMLLVAAVAAGVLLQTAGSLQQKALITGQQTRSEISTNVRVVEVSGVDAADRTVENLSMQLKLSPGSDPIKLDEVTVTFNTDDTTLTLAYSGDETYSNNTTNAVGSGTFGVTYLINGTNHIDGNLVRGDVARFEWVTAGAALGEDEHIRINFIPKVGTATLVEFNTPDVMSTQRVYLYP
jgi:flagellin-like protein